MVVVGSGAGGMVAAIRARDLGLSVAVMEKAQCYGGTSATSGGGIWIPAHDAIADRDSPEAALRYLLAASGGRGRESVLRTYVERAREVTRYLEAIGVHYQAFPEYPDYLEELPGVGRGRSMLPRDMDGALLGSEFFRLRDAHPAWVALGRYSLNFALARSFNKPGAGRRRAALKMVWEYWTDVPWRFRTRRDRRLTWGRALIGGLRKAMLERDIPLLLGMELRGLDLESDRIVAARFAHLGREETVGVRSAVILATGGFEQNQSMRDRWLPVRSAATVSATPRGGNNGDAITIGRAVGAAVESLSEAWWTPVVRFPTASNPNSGVAYPIGNHRGRPGSLMVNRLGVRFANESGSYDRLAREMLQDQLATGANAPCWLILDARFRNSTPVGGLLPAWSMPDSRVPAHWWDALVFKSDTITGLASRIGLDAAVLAATVQRFNESARSGVDERFQRGASYFDRYNGDSTHAPNPCLGALETGPFYAVCVDLGDLGTKGGLRVDEQAAVLNAQGDRIAGLYAVGNAACSPFIGEYPGGGATLGPAMTFGYLAVEEIAREARIT